jgi:hypothetical protein
MPFEKFYEASDLIDRRRLKFAALVVLIILGNCSICFLSRVQNYKSVIEKPPDGERLARVDQICTDLPKPEQFNFVEKTSLISSFVIEVNYKYKTDRSADEIAPILSIWFNSNGWRRVSGRWLAFQKNNYLVTVEIFDFPSYNYTINCAETN